MAWLGMAPYGNLDVKGVRCVTGMDIGKKGKFGFAGHIPHEHRREQHGASCGDCGATLGVGPHWARWLGNQGTCYDGMDT